jgi:hypothetical protein
MRNRVLVKPKHSWLSSERYPEKALSQIEKMVYIAGRSLNKSSIFYGTLRGNMANPEKR